MHNKRVVRKKCKGRIYDLKSIVYICYILTSSVLCVIPMAIYFISHKLYKDGRRTAAAASMEAFIWCRGFMVTTLIFIKVFLIIFDKYPHFLESSLIGHREFASIFWATMLTIPVFIVQITWRYYWVHQEVKNTKCKLVNALLKHSFLEDAAYGLPALISYNAFAGPFLSDEDVKNKKIYEADIAYEVYLYCSSYLFLLPAGIVALCKYFRYKKLELALSVTRLLTALAHVFLMNALLATCVMWIVFSKLPNNPLLTWLSGDYVSMGILYGGIISALSLVAAGVFCFKRVRNENSNQMLVPSSVVASVLKFGVFTAMVSNVCEVFKKRELLADKKTYYPTHRFVYDVALSVIASLLIIPACFAQLSLGLSGTKKKCAAVADRMHLVSRAILSNMLVFGFIIAGICTIPGFPQCTLSPLQIGFSSSAILSIVIGFVAVVNDLVHIRKKVRQGGRWEDIVLYDESLKLTFARFEIVNDMVLGTIKLALCSLNKDRKVTRTVSAVQMQQPEGPQAMSVIQSVKVCNEASTGTHSNFHASLVT